jgi:uncharacterized membrane-anchored protein
MTENSHQEQKYDSATGCLARLFWMMVGNFIVLFCAYSIFQNDAGFFGLADLLYWAVVGSLLAVRYADIRYLQGMTADGEPATMAHWRRYAVAVVLIFTGLWFAVHAVALFGR